MPPVICTPAQLQAAITSLQAGSGPVAVDAERAHGFRYSQRAYLIQLRRRGSGTHLIDPIAFGPPAEPPGSAGPADLQCARCGDRRRGVGHPRRQPGPALPVRGGSAAPDAVRHRARGPAARLPPGRPGHHDRGAARRPAAQGALRVGLVDPAAAAGMADLRRPRRRAAARAAGHPGRPAARGRQVGVGPAGVRRPGGQRGRADRTPAGPVAADLRHPQGPQPSRPRLRRRAVVRPGCDRGAPGPGPRQDPARRGDQRARRPADPESRWRCARSPGSPGARPGATSPTGWRRWTRSPG